MKSIARMALKDGMEIGSDVTNYHGDLIVPSGTIVNSQIIAKLERQSIICVDIVEDIDRAITHFEKIRFSNEFKEFDEVYRNQMSKYRTIMNEFICYNVPFHLSDLKCIHDTIRAKAGNNAILLDYLYNMLPNEDELTHTHCLNSALIAGVFADWTSLNEEEKYNLIYCGFLYDIGKLKLPQELLWKPGKLTDLEFIQIKTHPFLGYRLLDYKEIPDFLKRCALMHHERCNGSGYPSKLNRNQIDLYARYISIIDAYEAMTSPRSYRESLTPLQVIERFEKEGNGSYDDELIRPILEKIADTQIGLTVRLNDDSKWEVFIINTQKLSRPILKNDIQYLSLIEHPELKIISIY